MKTIRLSCIGMQTMDHWQPSVLWTTAFRTRHGTIPTKPSPTKSAAGSIFDESNMATKKRLILIASLPLTIAVTVGVLALLPPSPGVTKANFDRIQDDMTNADVKQILGGDATWIMGPVPPHSRP